MTGTRFLKRAAAYALRPLRHTGLRKQPAQALLWAQDPGNIVVLKKMGVSNKETRRLMNLPQRCKTTTRLFSKQLTITSPFWYLHGLKELFIDETYKFNAGNVSPFIIDCGSNIGLSIIYFKSLYPSAKIIGFEPDSYLFKIMDKNLSAFNYRDISLFEKAVWIENTTINFHSDGSVGGTIEAQNESSRQFHPVEAIRLRDFLDRPVDFLKIDIEGPEDKVLGDCADRLKNVRNLFIEYHSLPEKNQSLGEILEILKENDFRYYIKEAWENMHHPFVQKKGILYDLQLNIFAYRI